MLNSIYKFFNSSEISDKVKQPTARQTNAFLLQN